MKRRSLLALAGSLGLSGLLHAMPAKAATGASRTRPGDPRWPSEAEWQALARRLDGALERPRMALDTALADSGGAVTEGVLAKLANPFFLQDHSGSTQSFGWLDGWQSAPSERVGIPRSARDVSELVRFAAARDLRLVIKGGGHSYHGQSSAPDSLLIWTRDLRGIEVHDAFVPQGAPASAARPAVSVASGETFFDLYAKVVVGHGRYVQGGGCTSVGVGGHAQSGGFGHFSKFGGMTGANLLEAEVVLASGDIVIANADRNRDLFWALKGGGAGFGVTTRLTFATRDLPGRFGFIGFGLQARDEETYRDIVGRLLDFTRETLITPAWGEQIHFAPGHRVFVKMTFIDMASDEVRRLWDPILSLADGPDADLVEDLTLYDMPARDWWNLDTRARDLPGTITRDEASDRAGERFFWNGDNGETNVVWGGYESAWLSQDLLHGDRVAALRDTIVAAARLIRFGFHFQKGLAGAPEEILAEARDTPVHPSALDAFALLLVATAQQHVIPEAPGHALDEADLRARAGAVGEVYRLFRRIEPGTGSYAAEMNFHETEWQARAWGDNYPRLRAIKARHDPEGLFTGHHQVGSEDWSADGFTRIG
ncbi:MAG: FAD-binding protein [Roseicyclus sp.]